MAESDDRPLAHMLLTSELSFAVGTLSAGGWRLLLLLPLLLWLPLASSCRALLPVRLFPPCRQLAPHLEAMAEAPVALPRRRPLPPVLPLLVASGALPIHILPWELLLPSACTAGAAPQSGSWGWGKKTRWATSGCRAAPAATAAAIIAGHW